MSIHAIFRRYAPIAFTLTVAGSALATERGYRDLLVRTPAADAVTAPGPTARTTGYRATASLTERVVTPRLTMAAPARGYRDIHVRLQVPSTAAAVQVAQR